MADIDLTADNSSARSKHGIRSYVHTHGPFEAHLLILDEKKIAERFLVDSVTAGNADVMELIDVKKGDYILGGWSEVLVAGGTAASVPTWGTDADPNLFGILDPDATAGTVVSEAAGTSPLAVLVDGTVELVVITQILIRSVALSTGRWALSVLIYKGSALRDDYVGFESYVGDPNTPPQAF